MADRNSRALFIKMIREMMETATAIAVEIGAETKDTTDIILKGVKSAHALLKQAEDAAQQAKEEYLNTLIAAVESDKVSFPEIAVAIGADNHQQVVTVYRLEKCDRGQCYTNNCPRPTHDINNRNGNPDG